MITEQELKEKCTPEDIKWMVELAEGFEYKNDHVWFGLWYAHINDIKYEQLLFSLLIHRAVEGWNKTNDLKIRIFDEEIHTKKRLDHFAIGFYQFKNYQSQSLTQAECAMLHCLLDVFETGGER